MIKFKYNDKEFMLDFDRASVEFLERSGFSLTEYTGHIATMQPILFRGSFIKNHKFERNLDYNKMWDSIKNKKKFQEALLDMVAETYQSLMGGNEENEDNEGNENWEVI